MENGTHGQCIKEKKSVEDTVQQEKGNPKNTLSEESWNRDVSEKP